MIENRDRTAQRRNWTFVLRLLAGTAVVLSSCIAPPHVSTELTYDSKIRGAFSAFPDEYAQDAAELLSSTLDRVVDSPVINSCLSSEQRNALSEAVGMTQALGWGNIDTRDQLVNRLLAPDFENVLVALSATDELCDAQTLHDHLMIENADSDLGEFDPSQEDDATFEQYRQCMEEVVKNECHPLAAGGEAVTFDEGEVPVIEGTAGEGTAGEGTAGEGTAGEGTTGEVVTFDESEVPVIEGTAGEETDDGKSLDSGGDSLLDLLDALDRIEPDSGSSIRADAGSALGDVLNGLFGAGAGAIVGECFSGIMDSRLPVGHPLIGASFTIAGNPMGLDEVVDACTCVFHQGNPLVDFQCKDEDEQRQDCALNPFGPDDGPRPECLALLAKDNHVELPMPGVCGLMHCIDGMVMTEECGCQPASGGSVIVDACLTTTCPPDTNPVTNPQTNQCDCQPTSGSSGNNDLCLFHPEQCGQFDECLVNPELCNGGIYP